jgi:hypothetical protein
VNDDFVDVTKESPQGSSYSSSLIDITKQDNNLYNIIFGRENTCFNAAFKVKDLDKILLNCLRHDVKIIKDKHILEDEAHGQVKCAIIKSCVTGVTHSLFDCQNYEGRFLPGFEHHKKLALKESNSNW